MTRSLLLVAVAFCFCYATLARAEKFATLSDLVPDHENFDRSLLEAHSSSSTHHAASATSSTDAELDTEIENAYHESLPQASAPAATSHEDTVLAEVSSTTTRARRSPYAPHSARGRALRRRVRMGRPGGFPISMRRHPNSPLAHHRRGWNLAREYRKPHPTLGRGIPKTWATAPPPTSSRLRHRSSARKRRANRGADRGTFRAIRRRSRRTRAAGRKAANAAAGKNWTRDRKTFGSAVGRNRASVADGDAEFNGKGVVLAARAKQRVLPERDGLKKNGPPVSARIAKTIAEQAQAAAFLQTASRSPFEATLGAPAEVERSRAAQREMYAANSEKRHLARQHSGLLQAIANMRGKISAKRQDRANLAHYNEQNNKLKDRLRSFVQQHASHTSYFRPVPSNFARVSPRQELPPYLARLVDARRSRRRRREKRVNMSAHYKKLHDGGIPGVDENPERRQFIAQRLADQSSARGEGYFLETSAHVQQQQQQQLSVEQQNIQRLVDHEQQVAQEQAAHAPKVQQEDDRIRIFGSKAMPPMAPLP